MGPLRQHLLNVQHQAEITHDGVPITKHPVQLQVPERANERRARDRAKRERQELDICGPCSEEPNEHGGVIGATGG